MALSGLVTLTLQPLNGVMGHPWHGLPSCQFSELRPSVPNLPNQPISNHRLSMVRQKVGHPTLCAPPYEGRGLIELCECVSYVSETPDSLFVVDKSINDICHIESVSIQQMSPLSTDVCNNSRVVQSSLSTVAHRSTNTTKQDTHIHTIPLHCQLQMQHSLIRSCRIFSHLQHNLTTG